MLSLQNPFGDAKPREAVIASRTGKSEEEILKEAVKSERPKVGCVCSVAFCGKHPAHVVAFACGSMHWDMQSMLQLLDTAIGVIAARS